MTDRIGRNRNKGRRKRRRAGLKVRWKDMLVYGPLIVLLAAFTLGPFIIDLYEHPNLWNATVLVVVVVVITVMVRPKLWPKKKSHRPFRSA